MVGGDSGLELPLGHVLKVFVDCQFDRCPGRWWSFDAAERMTFRVGIHQTPPLLPTDPPRLPTDLVVVGRLQPAQALVVPADEPKQMRAELLGRVEAAALLEKPHAVEVERGHAPRFIGGDLPSDVGEVALLAEPL